MAFRTYLDQIPEILRSRVEHQWQEWERADHAPLSDKLIESLPLVWATSPFVAQHCLRDPGMLAGLDASGDLFRVYPVGEYGQALITDSLAADNQASLMRVLRLRRHRELVRIAWRDLAGWASLPETLEELSALADACVEAALRWLERDMQTSHGVVLNEAGEASRLIVLGMGKLGGRELNFSSDIDLILAYDSQGETPGPKVLSHEEYFKRIGRSLGHVLSEVTDDGFVYRVDTLLRPFGKSGPLVMHVDAMEQYYQSHGREWERYALIKARPIAGDLAAGEQLLKVLRPFIYRRYLDYSAFDSLREMKALIEQQHQRSGNKDNIKVGAGGIREIEFIAQAFQLIRGGHDHALQQRSLMPVLEVLERDGLLPEYAVTGLRESYIFLRRAENRLQAWRDQQTHELPHDDERQLALALAMGFTTWGEFCQALKSHRTRVQQQFEQVFAAPQTEGSDEAQTERIGAIWEETVSDADALALLKAQGLPEVGNATEFLRQLRSSAVYRGLAQQGRRRFGQLLPLLFGAARNCDEPEMALIRVLNVLEAIAGRTTYLALLVESPMALSQLVALCSASPWITHQISRHPILLDELLDPRVLYRLMPRTELEQELAEEAQSLALDDLEAQMDLLRHLKQTWVLRVAAADVNGSMRLMVVSDHLTDIAEILVQHAIKVAWQQMLERHGHPMRADGEEAGFAVIAYGKLGGIELGYGSDLDLVFVHDGNEVDMTDGSKPIDHGSFFTRLGQKIIHILTAQMASGVAYEVDMRLRPSGNSGLLVTSLDGYRRYQQEQAWTWEHQALVRARYICGSAQVGEGFTRLRQEILCQPRDAEKLRGDIKEMRQKMFANLGDHAPGRFDLKYARGGITDIEFLVQYLVLRHASSFPAVVRYSDNIRQLDALALAGAMPQADVKLLADAYRAYRKRLHALTLQEVSGVVSDEEFGDYRAAVSRLWQDLIEQPSRD